MQRVEEKKGSPIKVTKPIDSSDMGGGGTMNFAELRDVKIKLSRKEKELKEL